jgi:hypothetical protein
MTAAETAAWQDLERELAAWAATGRRAELWWRDDDAGAPTPALHRLLDLAVASGAPLALAVIPARAEPALASALAAHAADADVLQHGYAHANHAPAGAKKCELVDPAMRPQILDELSRGRERLAALFGARLRPVMVPPWNRIDPGLAARLPGLGFTALSTYKARKGLVATPGLAQVNCHLDILQWQPQRQFLGTEAALALLTAHLAAKRTGAADAGEPSGILSHHQAHDEAAWDFLAALLGRLARHSAVRLLPAAELFAAPRQAARERLP